MWFGLTRIGFWPFTLATLFFSIPQIGAYIFLGASGRTVLLEDSSSTLSRVLVAVAVLSVIAVVALIVRRIRKGLGHPSLVGDTQNYGFMDQRERT
jgi:uncharacterized membrane protein YdjX (TVP38/TMEM64 family)